MKVRFYKYYFNGMPKPIIMEAENRDMADQMIGELSRKSNVNIDLKQLIDLRIETPIVGISEKKRNGVELVWVGKENTSDGWMPKEDFNNINNKR